MDHIDFLTEEQKAKMNFNDLATYLNLMNSLKSELDALEPYNFTSSQN